MDSMTMEAVKVGGRISGAAIIDNVCNRIAERLGRNGDLRVVDSYTGYSIKVSIELVLHDVDNVTVADTVTMGQTLPPPPAPPLSPSQPAPITMDERVDADDADDMVDSLEVQVDGARPEPRTIVQPNLERQFDGSEVPAVPVNAPASAITEISGKRWVRTPPGSRTK